jgi:hypothetical protein
LPAGLEITHCQFVSKKAPASLPERLRYRVSLQEALFDKARLKAFNERPEFYITRTRRKGKLKKINLKDMVVNIDLLDSFNLRLTLSSGKTKTVRPAQILHHIFNLAEKQIKQAKIVKLKAQGREHRA